jgi:type VI protein secretion system component Hcp
MKAIIFLLLLFSTILTALPQNIAVTDDGNYTANSSAMLDVKSDSKGFLAPRMTQTQRDNISNPAKGLLIYQTDGAEGFYFNNGTPDTPDWITLTSEATSPWKRDPLTGITRLTQADDSVGIGTDDPSGLVSALGMIESMKDGFKFPDGSVQRTAAAEGGQTTGAGDDRWLVVMDIGNQRGSWSYGPYTNVCKILDFQWSACVPYANGLPQGNVYFNTVDVVKNIDKASVYLIGNICNALGPIYGIATNEFYFLWDSTGNKNYICYFYIKMENVGVINYKHTSEHKGDGTYAHLEHVSFYADKIRWEWKPDNVQLIQVWLHNP